MVIFVSAGAKNRGWQDFRKYLDRNNLQTRAGVYFVEGHFLPRGLTEMDVYSHPIKGLCCFSEDFGSSGTGVNDKTDCHVSVQCTGLKFLLWLGNGRRETRKR